MDVTKLTIGEMAKVEELSGSPMGHFGNDDKPQAMLMAALVFVLKKRENPDFKFAQALEMDTDELAEFLGQNADDDNDDDPKDKT